MKKIAHVQVIPKMSGVQQVSHDILSELSNNEYEKYIICGVLTNRDDFFIASFEAIDCQVIQINSFKREVCLSDIKAFVEFFRIFKKYKFDIVHTNSTKSGIVARIAARMAGIKKIVHTVHGVSFHSYVNPLIRFFYLGVENFASFFGDYNLSVNQCYTKYYLKKTITIHNGVKLSLFDGRRESRDFFHVAFMARLDEQKDPLTFIRAANYVVSNLPDRSKIKFTLAGNGELRSQCEDLVRCFKLTDYIDMPGWINDKSSFFENVDVICQPSKWEAFGLVFLEAALYEIPAIASNVEGIPEVVIHNQTGILVDKEDYEEFGKQIISLFLNRAKTKEIGSSAKKHVVNNFSLESTINKYLEIYNT